MDVPKNPYLRAAIEIGFILFLFYANLLMGEFTRSADHGKSFVHALRDIFTMKTVAIALVTAVAGQLGFTMLRERLKIAKM
jgi:hypothetical protein